jgi:hypothetical protein
MIRIAMGSGMPTNHNRAIFPTFADSPIRFAILIFIGLPFFHLLRPAISRTLRDGGQFLVRGFVFLQDSVGDRQLHSSKAGVYWFSVKRRMDEKAYALLPRVSVLV